MKKLVVNKDACIGCGACVSVDREHFDFDEQGYSDVISNENLDSDTLKNAINCCPVNAIRLEETACNCATGEACTCGDTCTCENCNCQE